MTDPRDDLARLEPFLRDFAEACAVDGEDTALVCAVCLRETLASWAPGYEPKGSATGVGDHGHGFGLFQIDDRGPYASLVRAVPLADPYTQARWCCWVLRDNRRGLASAVGNPLWERAVLSAYNAGVRRVLRALVLGHDPDSVTTGRDYGADVLRRRDRLRTNHPARFPAPAVANA